jgi:nucleotide sugar dehydrogenase
MSKAKTSKNPLIGFIGQGWIGRNYANDFEKRGYKTVRYALEPEYVGNKDRIAECDIVIIAVPTPSTPKGFDASIVESALKLVGRGKIAVIKSTIIPGTTMKFQKKNPSIILMYSPEFLSESTAAHDAANPFSNIAGIPLNDAAHRKAAKEVLAVLPKSPFELICSSTEAEFVKYSHNISGYTQIITFNIFYDLSQKLGSDWDVIHSALTADPYIPNRYSQPMHKTGRGAGGGCFIKDYAAFRRHFEELLPDHKESIAAMKAFESKNIHLLATSKKDLHLLRGVYGNKAVDKHLKKPKGKLRKRTKTR